VSEPDAAPDPVAALEAAAWALAAVVATQREAADASLAEVLAAAPERTAVLEAAGLVRRDSGELVPHPSLVLPPGAAGGAVAARLSSLRQAVVAAEGGGASVGWAAQDDEVLLNQGRASAATGQALATRIVPRLSGLAERLDRPGSRVLDVGTGVGALAVALARALPRIEVTGIDIMDHVLTLARTELAAAAEVAGRISLRRQDVADLSEQATYDLIWLPAPFLPENTMTAALPRVLDALVPGGWLVTGTNPAPGDPLRAATGRWIAARNGGNTYDSARMSGALQAAGLPQVHQFPTVPGGPILVAARRPGG
jgi:predicted O-methyltransferase YrrM